MKDNKEEKGAKKVISIILTVITVLIFLLAIYILINIVVCRIKNKPVSLFGTSFAIVQTGSMEPDIKVGDLIVFHSVDYNNIKVGDVIVFTADENFGSSMQGCTIVHQVIAITEDGLVTKGVHNLSQDGGYREINEVLGICVYNSAAWGAIFSFLSKYGILIIIAVIAIPVIIKLIIKIVKLSKEGDEAEKPKQADGEEVVEGKEEESTEWDCNTEKTNE